MPYREVRYEPEARARHLSLNNEDRLFLTREQRLKEMPRRKDASIAPSLSPSACERLFDTVPLARSSREIST